MNFIEQVFGISPDGGSGVLEFMLVLVPVLTVGVIYTVMAIRRKRV
jgi:hypothetical protein